MTLEKQIKRGAEDILAASAKASAQEPYLAIAQIVLAGAILAKTIDMPREHFLNAVGLAIGSAYGQD